MDEFEKSYKKLNELQRQAVDAIDGPVLVVAGPGTGKTELLSARVANILKRTDSDPSSILCLTFTNKAAVNMKSRIIKMAGPAGGRVMANTFHSFAAEIMNLYPDRFWNSAKLSVAPDTVQLDVVESIISELPLDNPLALKFAGQYTLTRDIQQAINLTKQAGLTPDKLRAIINANVAYIDSVETELVEILNQKLSYKNLENLQNQIDELPKQPIDEAVFPLASLATVLSESLAAAIKKDTGTDKCANTSKWKSRWVQSIDGRKGLFKERERNTWWLELAGVYEKYRQLLHARAFYDYADMLVEVIAGLEQDAEMRADIQERFNYVLIDEFQDTTPAQLRLAHLVADHFTAEGKPNLMAVGDDDQSIYKFNGAELNNTLNFKRSYPAAKIIILRDNYRSTQSLLDISKKVIEQADNRLVDVDPQLDKELVARSKDVKQGTVETFSYPSQELQLSEIAGKIKKSYKPGVEIAVLARSHESLKKMAAILQSLSVPVRYEQASNILDHVVIDQVYMLMKLLLAIQNGDKAAIDSLVHRIVRWPAWGIEPQELWRLAVDSARGNWLDSLLKSRAPQPKSMGGWFIELAAKAGSQPPAVTVEQLLGLRATGDFTSPIRNYYLDKNKGLNDYFHALSAMQLLSALVREFAADDQPTLEEFVRFIEINRENEVVIADESPFVTGDHAVQLLSVHKAKGLEFDHVYIIDATDDNWRPRTNGRKPPANLPLSPPLDDFNDYVRMMYVAMTRAKSSLTISSYYQDHNGKDVAMSTMIESTFDIKKVEAASGEELVAVLEQNLRWPDLSGGQEKQMLASRLETFNLSATSLLNFLDLTRGGPRYFKERDLLLLRDLKTPSMSYGTAMHAALDAGQKRANANRFDIGEIQKVFTKALKEEQLDEINFQRYSHEGQSVLERLFGDFGYKFSEKGRSEQKLNNVMVGQARTGGVLDRLDEADGHVTITDYKTGNPLSSLDTKDKTKALRAYKHKVQLIFYAMLINQQLGVKPGLITGQMLYVEAENEKQLSRTYVPTSEDITRMRQLIEAVWRHIITVDMPDISAYAPDIDGIRKFEEDLILGKI